MKYVLKVIKLGNNVDVVGNARNLSTVVAVMFSPEKMGLADVGKVPSVVYRTRPLAGVLVWSTCTDPV